MSIYCLKAFFANHFIFFLNVPSIKSVISIGWWPKFPGLYYQSIHVLFTIFRPCENKNKLSCIRQLLYHIDITMLILLFPLYLRAILVLLVIRRFYGNTRSDSIGCLHDKYSRHVDLIFLLIDFLSRRECITYFKMLKLLLK